MPLRFGTDGIRGSAGAELTPELVLAVGRAAGRVLAAGPLEPGARRTFVIGRDTRWSGPMLQAALSAGLAAEGVDVVDLGVLPTPGVAAVAAARGVAGRGHLGLAQPLARTTGSSSSGPEGESSSDDRGEPRRGPPRRAGR